MCHFSEHLLNNDRFCRDLLDSIVSIDNFNKTLVTFEINIYLSLIFSSMRFRVGNFKPSSQGDGALCLHASTGWATPSKHVLVARVLRAAVCSTLTPCSPALLQFQSTKSNSLFQVLDNDRSTIIHSNVYHRTYCWDIKQYPGSSYSAHDILLL